ncbi:MAG: hypothetical protein Kow00120_30160 [Anaerolineae bacterium]
MTRRLLIAVLALLMVAAPASGALAQWTDAPFCGDLAPEDCDLLVANVAAMRELASATYTLEMTSTATAEEETFSFVFNSEGALAYNKADMDALKEEVLDTTVREALALMRDPEALGDRVLGYVERVLLAPSADMSFEVVLPEAAMGGMAGATLTARVIMVDGVVYFTSPLIDTLMAAGEDAVEETWFSLDLMRLKDMAVEWLEGPAFAARMDAIRDAMRAGRLPMPAMRDFPKMQRMMARMAAFMSAPYWETFRSDEFLATFVSVARLDDAMVDDVPVAVFEMTLDFGALAETETFQEFMADYMRLFAFAGGAPSGAPEMETMLPAMMAMLKGTTMTYTQAIGLEDALTYVVDMRYTAEVDPAAMSEAMGETPGNIEVASVTQAVTMSLTLGDHNAPLAIAAPADAVSLIDLFRGMMRPRTD